MPRTSRAGCNDELTAVQVVAKLMECRRESDKYPEAKWADWRRGRLKWLLGPRPPPDANGRPAGRP